MDTDFHKFASNKDFLTYDEYVHLSLSHLQTPVCKAEIGNAIFIQDIRKIQFTTPCDYSELFGLFSENGRITYGSLRSLVNKVGMEIGDDDVLKMVEYFKREDGIGIEEFNAICQYGKNK